MSQGKPNETGSGSGAEGQENGSAAEPTGEAAINREPAVPSNTDNYGNYTPSGEKNDSSSTNLGAREQVTDAASRAERLDLPKSPAGQDADIKTSIEQPRASSSTERRGDTLQANQQIVGQATDVASRAERTDLASSSPTSLGDTRARKEQPDALHDVGKHGDVLLANQKTFGQSADVASRVERAGLSSKEREERLRIVTPADGVGFRSNSSELVPGTMEHLRDNLPENKRAALSDPHAEVIVTGSASRSGSDSHNLQLSQERADVVKQWLKDHGVQASINTYALGEVPAKQAGKPDGVDDASDRVVKIEVIPAVQASGPVSRTAGPGDPHMSIPGVDYGPAGPEDPFLPKPSDKPSELGFAWNNPSAALDIYNPLQDRNSNTLTAIASRFMLQITRTNEHGGLEKYIGPEQKHDHTDNGSQRNAFRHAFGEAITTRHRGEDIAREAGYAHEEKKDFPTDLTVRTFKGKDALWHADTVCDLLNNVIGREIGSQNPNASNQELAIKVLDYFLIHGLFTAKPNQDGSITISQRPITGQEYHPAHEILESLDNSGFTAADRRRIEDEKAMRLK